MAARVRSPSPKQTLSLPPDLPQACQERDGKLHISFGFRFSSCPVFNPYYQESVFTCPLLGKLLGRKTSLSEVGNGR